MAKKTLSKSKLMLGMQCHKNLWLSLNTPELAPEVDAATQMQFDEGNEVGELAREHFGKGVLIDNHYSDFDGAHKATQKAIKDGAKLIFEASFLVDGLFCRADVLKKTTSGWEMYEVKKSTSVKDYHLDDVAIQTHIIQLAGLKLKKIYLTHINNQCEFPKLSDLFTSTEITKDINTVLPSLPGRITELRKLLTKKAVPKVEIGPHCMEPFDCAFKDHCWKHIPEKSVFDLPGLNSSKAWALFDQGVVKITDLNPKDYKGNTQRAIEVTKKKKPFIDSEAIASEMKEWQWPLYFFDFETLGPAIPRYKSTKPYAQAPFQFSCHVWKSQKHKKLEHFEYLHTESSDPRPKLIEAMLSGLGREGSIVAYNMAFEIGVIKKLAEFDKKNAKKLNNLIERFVDPLPIFRNHVYHPDFLGSFSIKAVAPALIGDSLSYDEMEIGDGGTAQAYADLILRGKIRGKEKDAAVENLLEYCRQDTMAMVELVKWLMENA